MHLFFLFVSEEYTGGSAPCESLVGLAPLLRLIALLLFTQSTASEGGDTRSKVRERWLKDLFEEADKSGDGFLDVKEVLQMMHRLNVGISSKVLKQKFKVRTRPYLQ